MPKIATLTGFTPGDQYAADASVQYQYAGKYTNVGAPIISLAQFQNWFRMWANSTEVARQKMRRDYEYAEGNGKQWTKEDRYKVLKQGRPALEFNQILPQLEHVCGLQRGMEMDFKCHPRGYNDMRLAEIAESTIKAACDFGRIHRVTDRVFDDGVITGLGVWEVLHSLEDAEDLVWGDILVNRIHPQAFIYDPWSMKYDLQDGAFMGKAMWMDIGEFRNHYPEFAGLAVPGEWLSRVNQLIGSSDDLGTGPNLIPELWDQGTGRIRLLTLWYKVPVQIVLLVDEKTGECKEFNSRDDAEQYKEFLSATAGSKITQSMQIISTGSTAMFANPMGQPIYNPQTGAPVEFANTDMANAALNQLAQKAGMQAVDGVQVIKRTAKKPYWAEMVYWQVLAMGPSPFNDRNYPFVPYISRRWADDPESIFGVVRNLWDPQDEYNKRYSNLLAHVNSSSHSGWLNRKSGGANKAELELMGAKPGVVVEYAVEAPRQIEPTQLPPGHFAMIQLGEKNILRIASTEMLGSAAQQTVSGRALQARAKNSYTALEPRFRTFEEANLDLVKMIFSRIQQYYPPEKIRRILGTVETSSPMGPGGQGLFNDPLSGMPVPEEQIIEFLKKLSTTEFDIVFGLQKASDTERQAQFETALQISQLVTASGRPVGPNTFLALIDMADVPTKLATALKIDAMMPPVAPPNTDAQGKALKGGKGKKPPANGDGAPIGGNGVSGSTPNKQQAAKTREAGPDVGGF